MSDRAAIWAVAGPLLAFKVWVAILLLWYAPTRHSVEWLIISQWPTVLVVVLLVVGPLFAWWRLVKVRAKRERLKRAEWMLDEDPFGAEVLGERARGRPQPQWPLWETVSRAERDSDSLR